MREEILDRLDGVKQTGDRRYKARCPAHEDRDPSLSIYFALDGRILLHCFAGCSITDVLDSISLKITDLFPERLGHHLLGGEPRKTDPKDASHLRLVLDIAKADREAGKRLSANDLETERQAYLKLRKS